MGLLQTPVWGRLGDPGTKPTPTGIAERPLGGNRQPMGSNAPMGPKPKESNE